MRPITRIGRIFPLSRLALPAACCAAALLSGLAPAQAQLVGAGADATNGSSLGVWGPIVNQGASSGTATTNDIGPTSVMARARPEFQPQGLQFGSFVLDPSLASTLSYDSNIFGTQNHHQDDMVLRTRPELQMTNGPGLLQLSLDAYGEDVRYTRHSSLSNDNFGVTAAAKYDPSAELQIESRTNYIYTHQDPVSLTATIPNGVLHQLPVYSNFTQDIAATHRVGLIGLTIDGGYSREDYQNYTLSGVPVNQTILNANAFKITPKIDYALTPLIHPFVQAQYLRRSYDSGIFDSNGYEVMVGTDFEPGALVRGSVFVGYSTRQYDHLIPDESGFTYGINLAYFPSERLTLSVSGKQTFADTTILASNGTPSVANANIIQGEADYELLPQLIGFGLLSYENDSYKSTRRTDDIFAGGAGLKYLIGRNLSLLAQYQYSTRSSTVSGFNYDRHQIGIGAKLAF